MSYELRRNERRNRTKAIVITLVFYAGLAAWLTVGQDLSLAEIIATVWQPEVEEAAVVGTQEVRP